MKMLLWFLLASSCFGAWLEWDPNTEPEVAGYKVYIGGASRSYTNSVDVGLSTNYPITKERSGDVLFFCVTAYEIDENGAQLESEFSDEVSWAIPHMPAPVLELQNGFAMWTEVAEATNYLIEVHSTYYGTNFTTNTSIIIWDLPMTTEGSWIVRVRAQGRSADSRWSSAQIQRLGLQVPPGKHYVESSASLTNWAALVTTEGPVVLWYETVEDAGFYRTRPYFLSAIAPKGGKLVVPKPIRKKRPTRVWVQAVETPRPVGPINIDPATAR